MCSLFFVFLLVFFRFLSIFYLFLMTIFILQSCKSINLHWALYNNQLIIWFLLHRPTSIIELKYWSMINLPQVYGWYDLLKPYWNHIFSVHSQTLSDVHYLSNVINLQDTWYMGGGLLQQFCTLLAAEFVVWKNH